MTGPVRVALFDFDGTLCADNTLHLLMRELAGSWRGALHVLPWALRRKLKLAGSRKFKEGILGALRGVSADELFAFGSEIYSRRIDPCIRADGVAEMIRLSEQGFHVVMVTGAFDFLVAPFLAAHPWADHLCCRVEIRADGTCTGRILGSEMQGTDKVDAIRRHFAECAVDWKQSAAFTDSIDDRPMLELVGNRFLVRSAGTVRQAKTVERLTLVQWR